MYTYDCFMCELDWVPAFAGMTGPGGLVVLAFGANLPVLGDRGCQRMSVWRTKDGPALRHGQ
jgi:hypothetical protein